MTTLAMLGSWPGRPSTDLTLVGSAGVQADVGQNHVGGAGVVVHADAGQQENCDCGFI